MNRKSPVKHKVHSYRRNGITVHAHTRGSGRSSKSKMSNPVSSVPKGYTVKLTYEDKTTEEIKVIATSYQRAVDEAFEEKLDLRMPIEISVIDPSIGEVIKWAGKNAAKYGTLAAKAAYSTTKNVYTDVTNAALENTAKGSGFTASLARSQIERRAQNIEEAKKRADDAEAARLVDRAYSRNKKVRTLARAKLRRDHPNVWNVMDISRR